MITERRRKRRKEELVLDPGQAVIVNRLGTPAQRPKSLERSTRGRLGVAVGQLTGDDRERGVLGDQGLAVLTDMPQVERGLIQDPQVEGVGEGQEVPPEDVRFPQPIQSLGGLGPEEGTQGHTQGTGGRGQGLPEEPVREGLPLTDAATPVTPQPARLMWP